MKNWKTTLFGGLAAIFAALIPILPEYKEILSGCVAVSGSLFAYFSKDKEIETKKEGE